MNYAADYFTNSNSQEADFAGQVRRNQQELASRLKPDYDFIVCGSGSSGSVVARRLAENPSVSVLLLEAGGHDDVPAVMRAEQWPLNLGSERDWGFFSQPSEELNGRSIPMSMGKVVGGGSSINVMIWARGHKRDWDFFATEAGDPAWNYDSVLEIYRAVEDWHGAPDPDYRGTGGPVFVQPAPDPSPIAQAMVEGAQSVGIPSFENQNGRMMEGPGGAAITDLILHDGYRQSVFRSYVFPYMHRPNLTVLTAALVTRVIFDGHTATGVEFTHSGSLHRVAAASEVVLSLGAINTPKVLMQSGVGDEAELRRHGIPVVQHLPGVGRNLQDHVGFDCVWEYRQPLPPRNNGVEATYFWTSITGLDSPDLQTCQAEFPKSSSAENTARFRPPETGWNLFGGLVQPKSRGEIRLTGPSPLDPVEIHANMLSHPDDVKAAIACVELCRAVANSAELRAFTKREVMPGNLKRAELERFVRDAASSYWHQSGSAKMGQDAMSVVDGALKVYGMQRLRIADGSIMPRVTTGNTQAPCVIIGERAAAMLRAEHHA
ncbi:oxidoreductase [Mycobacterium vulneris]|jgi:choline dehydrogenase|uniref:Oxidoreductase n=1 Tax=Mycolicibacterium vulneris TaxID=547163 RepID=A0A1X2KV31_9MYCO|nr:GMC family oxidoreductase N-terminal domain-containing protein [Mycolicibacterium vulneris]OSC25629.1 oxidoreductase [Mycolicibacterium vulneris]